MKLIADYYFLLEINLHILTQFVMLFCSPICGKTNFPEVLLFVSDPLVNFRILP